MFLKKPKIKPREKREFDQDLFQQEVRWLTRIKEGKTAHSSTPAELIPALFSAAIITIFAGMTTGAMISYFAQNLVWFVLISAITFVISFLFSLRPYAELHLDLEEDRMQYEGSIMYAGDERKVNYRGSYQVIDGVQLVRHSTSRKLFIRFLTNSGYMRINYNPTVDEKMFIRFEELGVLDRQKLEEAKEKGEVLKKISNWHVLFEEKFDRTEFKNQLKEQREQERIKEEEAKEEKRRMLLEKSKQRVQKNS